MIKAVVKPRFNLTNHRSSRAGEILRQSFVVRTARMCKSAIEIAMKNINILCISNRAPMLEQTSSLVSIPKVNTTEYFKRFAVTQTDEQYFMQT